jgi:hypothetical protein
VDKTKIKGYAFHGPDAQGKWDWHCCDNIEDCRLYHALDQMCPCVRKHIRKLVKGMPVFIETNQGVEKIIW